MDLGTQSRREFLAIAAASSVPFLMGCGYPVKTVRVAPEEQYALRQASSSHVVCVDLYDDGKECKTIFNNQLTDKGYLPVFLLISNKGQNTYILPRENVAFIDSRGVEWTQVTGIRMSKSFDRSPGLEAAGMGLLFGLLGGLTAWLGASKWNEEMSKDYESKMLPIDRTIHPQTKTSGFIYFREPNGHNNRFDDKKVAVFVDNGRLMVPLVDTVRNTRENIEVLLKPD
ncbi:MAG: hypothetical protein AABX29_03645 [Nanoarchaeota archaeon]